MGRGVETCIRERHRMFCGLQYMVQTVTTTGDQQREKSPRA